MKLEDIELFLAEMTPGQHDCTTIPTAALRFKSGLLAEFLGGQILEQGHQCMHCGKIDWRPVPTVYEEGGK